MCLLGFLRKVLLNFPDSEKGIIAYLSACLVGSIGWPREYEKKGGWSLERLSGAGEMVQ